MGGKHLFALDFDFTVIDEDSDHYIIKTLAPHLMDKMKELQPSTHWTDLCHLLVGDLHQLGYTPHQMNQALRTIPFNPAMRKAFEFVFEKGHDLIIISDANTIYIEEIAIEKGIHKYISRVITNPGYYDEQGRLHIEWFSKDAHGCPNRCAKNICKGRELLNYLEGKDYAKRVYVGDGSNDFCPSTKLKEGDWVLPRSGMAFSKLLLKEENRSKISATLIEWTSADDVLEIFQKILQ